MNEVFGTLKLFAIEKGLELKLFIDEEFSDEVLLDIRRVKEVLYCLLQNALKFTYSGSITLTIKLSNCNKLIVFEVIDTGMGINPEAKEFLFRIMGQLK